MNTIQLEKIKRSNAKVDDLYRKIDCNDNQWFALDFILDYLTEKEKVKVRSYIKGLIKDEKTNKIEDDVLLERLNKERNKYNYGLLGLRVPK